MLLNNKNYIQIWFLKYDLNTNWIMLRTHYFVCVDISFREEYKTIRAI